VPPGNVSPGESAPQRWVDEYNRQVKYSNPETPWPTDWSIPSSGKWNLVYAEDRPTCFVEGTTGLVQVNPFRELIGLNNVDYRVWVFNPFIGNVGGVLTAFRARISSDPFLGIGSRGIWYQVDTNAPGFIRYIEYFDGESIQLVSATRVA